MDWLNFHHLLYFWTVVREGSMVAAAKALRLSQPTISAQIRKLEDSMETQLFERVGRRLELTDAGRHVFAYADEIFGLGRELQESVQSGMLQQPKRLRVGIVDALPKLLVHNLLEPLLGDDLPYRLVCRAGQREQLVGLLATHELDLVLSDAPAGKQLHVRAFNHSLGHCGSSFMAGPELYEELRADFPRSLDGAPFLMPTENTALRLSLEHWFSQHDIHPHIVAEFEDSAVLKVFGGESRGVFVIGTVIEDQVTKHYGARPIGRSDDVRERFYAISVERRLRHPAVVALSEAAKAQFNGGH